MYRRGSMRHFVYRTVDRLNRQATDTSHPIFTRSERVSGLMLSDGGHDARMTTLPQTGSSTIEAGPASSRAFPSPMSSFDGVASSEGNFLVLDSCHSTWLFDVANRRFRRVLKGLDVEPSLAATDWRSYERLELAEGSEAFVVVLNAAGTRRIRSWRHVDGCEQCEGERTSELSLEDLRRLSHA